MPKTAMPLSYPKQVVANSEVIQRLSSFFNPSQLDALAKESKFIQRASSRLESLPFLCLQVFQEANGEERSLRRECDYLGQHFDVHVQKQSLDERYNTYAVRFMKLCLGKLLQEVLVSCEFSCLQTTFTRIRLTDSTSFQLPAHLAVFYQSGGGSTSSASIKIHQEYDLLTGQFLDVSCCSGKDNDRAYLNERQVPLQPGDLSIKDLGYHQVKDFQAIAQAGAFYLSRYKAKTDLYLWQGDSYQAVRLEALLEQTKTGISYPVLLSSQHRLPTRLFIEPVDEATREKRMAYLKKTARRTGWQHTKLREQLCGYNIFITNTSQQQLPDHLIRKLYSLRWQIELLFKTWKGLYQINKVKKMSIFRFESYLLGRLMAICLAQNLQHLFKQYLYEKMGVELSTQKAFQLLKSRLFAWQEALRKGEKALITFLRQFFQALVRYGQKESKKIGKHYRLTPYQLLASLT